MKNKKNLALFVLAVSCLSVSLSSCTNEHATKWKNAGEYTYQDYTTVSPSNWNELTYQDNNDTQIMSYIGSSFFTYDFKFDAQGNILPGEFEVKYSAATKLEDVTTTYAGDANYAVPAEATHSYAYKITLRNDLKWEDGTPIKAEDFVYTMHEQLNPEFKNYRADSFFVGATVIHNAREYFYQGETVVEDNYSTGKYAMSDLVKAEDGTYKTPEGKAAYFAVGAASEWCSGNSLAAYAGAGYLNAEKFAVLNAMCNEEGYVVITDEAIAALGDLLNNSPAWGESDAYCQVYVAYEYEYPQLDASKIGIFAESDTELVVVLDKSLSLLKADGSLDYTAAYNFSSLPLVKKDLYEANKVAPTAGTTLWTSTYNSSVESTASWGPYKLTQYQAGKEYVLERNENWYGYGMDLYAGQYQTTRIAVETIDEWNTAWLKFQSGSVDGIVIDVSIAQDYKNSSRALFTPSDFVGSLQLQSDATALKGREKDGEDKEMLAYNDFRKALSLSIDRAAYASQCTTSSLAGFGLFNSMHYYDVANGGVYRNEDVAKQVLCDVYAVDSSKYSSLAEAEKAITGYNLAEARKLVNKAYEEAKTAGTISDADIVKLEFGTGSINESVQRQFDFIKNSWVELVKTTPLEGRLELTLTDHQSAWASDFRSGAYEVCMGGLTGAAWDPGYFLLAYLSPDYMYSTAWKTDEQQLTYTVNGYSYVDQHGETVENPTLTMSLMDWYDCLNGAQGAAHNWSVGFVDNSVRLGIIAALEKEILSVYYTVPLVNSFSASLLSYKVEYITSEYNTFMSYGGIRYMTYNYDDAEWFEYVKKNKIDYTA